MMQVAHPGSTIFARAVRLREAGRWADALAAYRKVLAAEPGDARALQHLGGLLFQLGRAGEAEAPLRRSLELDPAPPEARHALALCLMAQGRFAEARPHYAARFAMPGRHAPRPERFPFPEWDGADPAGRRIAIFPEQGFGDQIMYARFAGLLLERGAEVTLLAPPALTRLFADSFGGSRVTAASGAVEFPDPDVWAMACDLPALCGATLETLPAPPYLRAEPADQPPGAGFRIGLATAGNPEFAADARRSLSAADAARLRDMLPGDVVSLAPADSGARDFADTAALMQSLDLIVSTDTSVLHLAGALGRPALALIQGFAADWRWCHGRETTPWYPATKVFRGTAAGDWSPALRAVASEARARMTM